MKNLLLTLLPLLAVKAEEWADPANPKNWHGLRVITECKVPGMVALTFDDGVTEMTSDLLDILKEEKVRATFFVLGREFDEDPKHGKRMLKRMWKEGHDIGSHSYSHPYLTSLSDSEIRKQMKDTNRCFIDSLGYTPVLMRPPYGAVDSRVCSVLNGMGFKVVNWDIDSDDWRMEGSSSSAVAEHITGLIKPLSRDRDASHIILMHEIYRSTIDAQRRLIKDIKRKGYKLGNMSECLGGPVLYNSAKAAPSETDETSGDW